MEKHFKNKMKYPSIMLLYVPASLVLALIFGLLVASILFGMLDVLSTSLMGSLVAVVIVFLLLLSRIPASPDYVITDKEVRIVKRGMVVKTYPYSRYQMTPHVYTLWYAFIPITARTILMKEGDGKPKRVGINIRKQEFAEFVEIMEKFS
ncbi:hypothetical protein JZO70_16840 [Enterococcus sp. 669A]|uniref:PH domain-containing protein n=1 Tax=Candidatus Enterococcus moelleringii TaxID=2815325 RepID=A0ABS3LDZ6_9ENTE|nr:hypothetical protein [Enterococcus sp. 669A]MBO1307844.1 hypothetical protein [Enterococcus sp. 669A]